MALSPGTKFGPYEIVGLLGAGGMGMVYRARDPRLGREVALKTLPPDLARSAEFRARFEREGRLLAALTHPNVATIYGLEDHDQVTALVLELVDGPMLSEWIAAEKRPIDDVLRIATQVAAGLEAAHARGIVHRDLKPANVRIGKNRGAKVLDFGIAVAIARDSVPDSTTLTSTEMVLGTPGYLAPEQAAGMPPDKRSDVWAFGALLFEMIARRPAFLRPSPRETLAAVLTGQVLWETVPPGVPASVRALLEDCLSVEVERRPSDGSALRVRLEACIGSTPGAKEPASLLVLPFESLHDDAENESFTDGLTEEVIADLATIAELRVFSRATALRYRAERRDGSLAARELGASYVLDGSVRRAGTSVRVTVQLVDTSKDSPVWADKYAGTLEDVFSIQETISRSIASALRLKLEAGGDRRFAERRRGSAAAYDVYLRTRNDVYSFDLARLERARAEIERALAELGPDPYLYGALGRVAWQYVNAGFSGDPAHLATLDDCIRRLDDLDPGGVHVVTLRALRAMVSGDICAWYRALERVEAVDPGNAEMSMWRVMVLSWVGRTEEARAIVNALSEVDPFNEYLAVAQFLIAQLEGRFDDARRLGERGIEEFPGSLTWPSLLIQLEGMTGDREGARATLDACFADPHAGGLASLGNVFVAALFGDEARVRELMTPEFERLMWNDFQYSHMIAQSSVLLGRTDDALRWLERAVERGFLHHRFFGDMDPLLAPLRGDARFQAILDKARRAAETFPGDDTGVQRQKPAT
ncbi:MAG: protein kinase domain-containing protein [Candidatus Eiseniibacteriota bacterium]